MDDPRLSGLVESYADALKTASLQPSDIVRTVWSTHRDQEVLLSISRDIQASAYSINSGDCSDRDLYWVCDLSFEANDYRDQGAIVSTAPQGSYSMPFRLWYPKNGDSPAPIMLYGHGLNSDIGEGGRVAENLLDMGFAVIASPAVEHIGHPDRTDDGDLDALRFLGVDLANLQLDGFRLRSNFNQTNLDRLQLIQALRQSPNLPVEQGFVLDPERMVYLGISLGGMLGSGLLAMDNHLEAGILSVAGGQLVNFVTDTESIASLR